MNLIASKVLLTTLGCVLIAGCSVFEPKHMAGSSNGTEKAKLAAAGKASPLASAATDAGRALLDDGQPGTAIEVFRRALANGESPGPALNGLGVAFARIGRQDVAIRYFQQAVVFDPAEARYAMNLERMKASLDSRSAAPARLAEMSVPSVRANDPPVLPLPVADRPKRAEIRIVTARPQPASGAVGTGRNRAGQSLARIEFADRADQQSSARWIDVTPKAKRITHVGAAPAPMSALSVRLAASDPR